ncbi:hypothetical protein [Nannocystis punicea]|uniref:Uncharacterized protein n=1 Tax=Nannocystis punicea TaxID=2995304 RepID=A0ABY7GW31_9BACT|nr:hypothetical protein [Nannocystis poenicansa]WAS91120.1 hypothetical protein O0S08_33455 [Nannocystis poenicansa]
MGGLGADDREWQHGPTRRECPEFDQHRFDQHAFAPKRGVIESGQGAVERGQALVAEVAVDHELAEDARKRAVEPTGLARAVVVAVVLASQRRQKPAISAWSPGPWPQVRSRCNARALSSARPAQPAASRPSGER